MRIRYYCHYSNLTGYGRAARDYLSALRRLEGIDLEIADIGNNCRSPEGRYGHLDRFAVPASSVTGAPDLAIYHTTPKNLCEVRWPESLPTKKVAITTWETDCEGSRNPYNFYEFDAVIAPSKFSCDLLSEFVRSECCYSIPHCFDPEFWKPWVTSSTANRPYRFYSIGAWNERKNPVGLLKAYLHEFRPGEAVLAIFSSDANLDEARSLAARSGLHSSDLPEVHIINREITEGELLDIHSTSDCFATATRGEAFGLGIFEAAIMGKRVVAPGIGGHFEFMRHYNTDGLFDSFRSPCFGGESRGEIVEENGRMFQKSTVLVPPGMNCRQTWVEPDLVSMAEVMRNATAMPPIGDRFRFVLEDRFGYATIGKKLLETLKEIAQ